jgi:hypothetical protein
MRHDDEGHRSFHCEPAGIARCTQCAIPAVVSHEKRCQAQHDGFPIALQITSKQLTRSMVSNL